MKRTWIISQLFYPDETSTGYVLTRIAERLVENENINVICGSSNYHSNALIAKKELSSKIQIHRINTPLWNKNNLIKRSILFFYFTFKVFFKVLRKVRKGDKIILVTNPPTLLVVIAFLKKFLDFELVIILQDIFPENAAASGMLDANSRKYKFILNIINSSYRKADKLIACGEDMAELFRRKGIENTKIFVITNWADFNEIKPDSTISRNEYYSRNFDKKVIIQFAGNIGRVQGLDSFVKIFLEVNNPLLALVIIGDGAFKNKIIETINSMECNKLSVILLPSKPRSEQNSFLNCCDIGLVTLCEGMFGLGVPSKVYNILAAGKPILYVGDPNSEIDNYIKSNNIGWSFNWSSPEEMISFLKSIDQKAINHFSSKGIIAREFIKNNFTEDKILDQYLELI